MISIEEVRQVVISKFKTVHDIAYPDVLVNYPNFVVVDLEHQTSPFVSIDLEIPESAQAALGESEIFIRGNLVAYYYYQDGTGMSGAYSYTDFLNSNIGFTAADSVQYEAVAVTNIVSFPGWKGCMNRIPFSIVQTSDC